ncbi:unnamed protein product [Ectocarpus sp. CCAP 1310/34]|nr:unnamed protein product [Ectocarpus sp. CCAP 1310/34]
MPKCTHSYRSHTFNVGGVRDTVQERPTSAIILRQPGRAPVDRWRDKIGDNIGHSMRGEKVDDSM